MGRLDEHHGRQTTLLSDLTGQERDLLVELTANGAWAPDVIERLVRERVMEAPDAYAAARRVLVCGICSVAFCRGQDLR